MSEDESSILLNLVIDHCYTSISEHLEIPKSGKETITSDEPSPQHVFKVPVIPKIRSQKTKVNQSLASKETSKNNFKHYNNSVPQMDSKQCKYLLEEKKTVPSNYTHNYLSGSNKEMQFYRKCSKCLKTYMCKMAYLQHKQKCRHRQKCIRSKQSAEPLLCGICLQLFECKAAFEKHTKRCLHRCIHPCCYNSFISRSEMVKHLYQNHMGSHDVHYLQFENWNMLNMWKVNEATVNMLSYENKSFEDLTHHYFTCHRSGIGTVNSCPSKMLICQSGSLVEVQYVPLHNHELLSDNLFDFKSEVPIYCAYQKCNPVVSFDKESEMLAHLQKSHKMNIDCVNMEFESIIDFFVWKGNATSPHFMYLFKLKGHAISKTVHSNYYYYFCGYKGKQILTKYSQCLARMVVHELKDCVKVRYFPYHIHQVKSLAITHEKVLNGHCGIEIPLVPGLTKKQIL